MLYTCSLKECINQFSVRNQRIERNKSGLFFCSNDCKNEALKQAYQDNNLAYKTLVPDHYQARPICSRNGCDQKVKQHRHKYCSSTCTTESKKEYNIKLWLEGTTNGGGDYGLANYVRNYLLQQGDYKCSQCEWGEKNLTSNTIPLEIDHIDGDHTNNRPENLRILCPSCHSLTSNYKSLNRDKDHQSRYSYYREKGWW